MATRLTFKEREGLHKSLTKILSTFRMASPEGAEVMMDEAKNIVAALAYDLIRFPPSGDLKRKVIQIESAPVNLLEIEESFHIVNSVFALCDDGTIWLQLMGSSSAAGWIPIDNVPQGDFDEINQAHQDEGSGD